MNIYLFRFAQLVQESQLNLPKGDLKKTTLNDALQIVFGLMGAVSLLVIVVAGLRYVLSQGDPGSINKAKNAVVYAVVGLVVSSVAFSIVRFVLTNI